MTFNKSGTVISVDKVDGLGKNYGLYVGNESEQFKVASFGNDEKAEMFCRYLKYLCGIMDEPPKEDA